MKNLINELYDSLRTNSSNVCVTDYSLDKPIHITKKQILIMATALSKDIAKSTNSDRVGIVIPSCVVGVIANVAVLLADKIPVNLNFSVTNDVARHCLAKSGINLVLTVSAMRTKFADYPFPDNTFDCDTQLKAYKSDKCKLIKNYILHSIPKTISKRILNILPNATSKEFAVLFTSGSSGSPKGVSLSHENILSNVHGICEIQKFPKNSKLLANLPLFHSFGFTVTMWLPLIKGIPIVTIPSPLEINKTIAAIQAEQVSILLGTPTFLRGYLKKGSSNKFKSIKYVVAGAEKSNIDFIKQWETLANCNYLEGYGLTESSPVISLNTTTNGIKHGSVGKLLPSIKVKTIHPETHQDLGRSQSGVLCFQGNNIFTEYIMDKQTTQSAFKDGWFVSGDVGRLDEDGFLFIEGRLSRFSKIGGEMIPHETIEECAVKILEWESNEATNLVVVGKPHATKGEELILITTQSIDFDNLRSKLSKQLGNLFVPKKHQIVNEIPVLATGKLDLHTIKSLVN